MNQQYFDSQGLAASMIPIFDLFSLLLLLKTTGCVFELLVRDYFRYFAARHGRRIFYLHGTAGRPEGGAERVWKRDPELIGAWLEGRTGHPLVSSSLPGFSLNVEVYRLTQRRSMQACENWEVQDTLATEVGRMSAPTSLLICQLIGGSGLSCLRVDYLILTYVPIM